MTIVDRIKRYWLVELFVLASTIIGGTWVVANEVLVKPRDFTIEQYRMVIEDLNGKLRESQQPLAYPSKQETSQPTESAIILPPTWVYLDKPIQVVSGQILVEVSYVYEVVGMVSFELEVPGQPSIHFFDIVGTRETFTYKDNTYFLDILEINTKGAKIAITKQL